MGFMKGSSTTHIKNKYYGTQVVSGKGNKGNKGSGKSYNISVGGVSYNVKQS
jgi:hypothetical protein